MKPHQKMSLQDLKDMFGVVTGAPGPEKWKPSRATNKGFAHKHNPAAKPSKGVLTPAQWHRKQRGKPAPYNYR